MSRTRGALRIATCGALFGAVGLVQSASGQDGATPPAGLRATLDYSLGVDVDSNYRLDDPSPGTYYALVNGFDFSLLSNTRTETFALNFGTQLRLQEDPEPGGGEGDPVDWTDPVFELRYTRLGSRSRLSLSADASIRDVDTLEPFFVDVDGDTIIDSTVFEDSEGTLTETAATVTLETGIDAPVGTAYSFAFSSRDYTDTSDPDLYDRLDYRLATSTRLRFSGVAVGLVDLSFRQYEYDYTDGRDVDGESLTASVGLDYAVSPILGAEASVGYSKTREVDTFEGDRSIDEEQGPNFNLRLTRELTDGSAFVDIRRDLVEDTFRSTLVFGRTLSRPVYELSADVGLTALDGGEPSPTFGVFFSQDLSDAQFTASLSRTVTVDTDDEERALTSAIVGYSQRINELSSFRLGFDYSLVTGATDADDEDGDEERATFLASYSRSLTRDWSVSVGYRGRTSTTDTEDAFSNAVFVNVGRQFLFRP